MKPFEIWYGHARTPEKISNAPGNGWVNFCFARAGKRRTISNTKKHLTWIKSQVRFEQPALQAAFLDYVHEVEHAADRLERLEKAIDDAITSAPIEIQDVVQGLQALRGVGKIVAVSIVAEVGSLSRFRNPRQLMSYSGMVASEHSSGCRIQRGGITKTGNAHLRRVMVEAAWAYQHKPWIGGWLAKRQQGLDEETKNIPGKAQWRLCTRYKKLLAKGKNKPQIVTALGRELLGFVWAIAVRIEARHGEQRCAA
jgi:transposase